MADLQATREKARRLAAENPLFRQAVIDAFDAFVVLKRRYERAIALQERLNQREAARMLRRGVLNSDSDDTVRVWILGRLPERLEPIWSRWHRGEGISAEESARLAAGLREVGRTCWSKGKRLGSVPRDAKPYVVTAPTPRWGGESIDPDALEPDELAKLPEDQYQVVALYWLGGLIDHRATRYLISKPKHDPQDIGGSHWRQLLWENRFPAPGPTAGRVKAPMDPTALDPALAEEFLSRVETRFRREPAAEGREVNLVPLPSVGRVLNLSSAGSSSGDTPCPQQEPAAPIPLYEGNHPSQADIAEEWDESNLPPVDLTGRTQPGGGPPTRSHGEEAGRYLLPEEWTLSEAVLWFGDAVASIVDHIRFAPATVDGFYRIDSQTPAYRVLFNEVHARYLTVNDWIHLVFNRHYRQRRTPDEARFVQDSAEYPLLAPSELHKHGPRVGHYCRREVADRFGDLVQRWREHFGPKAAGEREPPASGPESAKGGVRDASEGENAKVPAPALPTTADLKSKKTTGLPHGMTSSTWRKIMHRAGVRPNRRGEKVRRWDPHEVERLIIELETGPYDAATRAVAERWQQYGSNRAK